MPSIFRKLFRDQTKTMHLTQMQDIGGCRAVVRNLAHLNQLFAYMTASPCEANLARNATISKRLRMTVIVAFI